jgi:hypothetical protein
VRLARLRLIPVTFSRFSPRAGRRIAKARRLAPATYLGPPERNFPLPVVIAHGTFAVTSLTLVLLTVFGVGGS